MADMADPEMAVSLARMETKLDIALGDHSRRHTETEEDRKVLHANQSALDTRVTRVETDLDGLKTRVGGAFSKFATPIISACALAFSLLVFVYKL